MKHLNNKQKYMLAIPIIAIIIVAGLFHYPIHIQDALSLEALPEYGISISIWRVLFEPILGPMLFYSRADQMLVEPFVLIIWIVVIYLALSIIRSVKAKKDVKKWKYFLKRMANIPVIFVIWLSLFLISLLVTLPGNTIVNNDPNVILVNTHSHSEFSHDGLMSQYRLWKWHKHNGFDAFYITDHGHHKKTLEFVEAQKNGEYPSHPLVMCGEEYSGSNHITLLGLKRNFDTKSYSDSTAIDSAHANDGAAIIAHWFQGERKTKAYYAGCGADGFEIEKQGKHLIYDRRIYHDIVDFCTKNNLILNGAADYHGYGSGCYVWNSMEIPGWHDMGHNEKQESIVDIFRNRDQSKLKVLLYKDRFVPGKKYVFLSPVFTTLGYFRTLKVFQVISWAVWIIVFALIKSKISKSKKTRKNKLLISFGLLSGLYLIGHGLVYLSKVKAQLGHNEIYAEYTPILLSFGIGAIIYSLLLLYINRRRKKGKKEVLKERNLR